MVNLLDGIIGELVDKLKAKGLWENTLVIATADNGGTYLLAESGSTNYPLRGGKYTFFEGGVRAAAFLSGGYLPAAVRGTKLDQPIHISDWYATLSQLAGVAPKDHAAEASGLPPIDGVDMGPLIFNPRVTVSPRVEIPLGPNALIHDRFKFLTGKHK